MIERKDHKWCVYIHTSPSNKYYVGITSQKPQSRWRNGRGYAYNTYFTRAINKYGWDNFRHEVVASDLAEEEAKKLEIELIAKLQSNNAQYGYNLSSGGDGVSGISRYGEDNPFYGKHHSEETKMLMRERHLNMSSEDYPFYGKHHSDETKKRLSIIAKERFKNPEVVYHPVISEKRKLEISKQHSKAILQYDLNMNLIGVHDSLLSLEKLGYRRASIRDVCLGRRESYEGCIWMYQKDSDAWTSGYIVGTKADNIYCFDNNLNVVGIYKSYLEASKKTGISRKAISNACKTSNHYSFGYYWLFKDDCESFLSQPSFVKKGCF